LKHNDLI